MVEIESPGDSHSHENKANKFLTSMGWVICLVILLLSFLTVVVGYQMQKKAYHRIDELGQSILKKQASDQGLSDQYGEIQGTLQAKLQEVDFEVRGLKKDLSKRVAELEAEHQTLRNIDRGVQDAMQRAKAVSRDLAVQIARLGAKLEDVFSD